MSDRRGTESEFELATIARLEQLGYRYTPGIELDRAPDEVVLRRHLRKFLARQYPDLPDAAIDLAVLHFVRPEGVDTLRRNMAFHERLVRGYELPLELIPGHVTHRLVYAIDWEYPERNEFVVANQFPIHGRNDRRPDIVLFVNGLPLAVFELKNPYSEDPTVHGAWNQIQHYRNDIPQLFDYNALTVVSDGVSTLHGMWTANEEWYAPWKSIDGINVEPATTASMKALLEGLFPPKRLLSYVRDFIVFQVVNDRITKKGAKYHQFFAVRLAARKTIATMTAGRARRLGVIWHTTGSGKSLSMIFLVGILRRRLELGNPTFVIEVDRNDLDDQLHDEFVAARSLVGPVEQAESVEDLRRLLQTQGGEVVFTTIEKFRLKEEELAHPVLSLRDNIIIIADEAHRSQYGFLQGYARYLAEALPNARRLGFTGTPISFSGADTQAVFGNVIHTYTIGQAQEDHATVPIFYAPRQIKLHLGEREVDAALAEIAAQYEPGEVERRKSRWAALAAAAGSRERVKELAADLLAHFRDRTSTLRGKAMAVCMTRENCVRLYDELRVLPGCPEVKVVMTGNLAEDPPQWSEDGHLTTKAQRESIKERLRDLDDPLRIVIVCDMWLTGTDIPCLHTLYVDKPMIGHNMIQAISRVNRVFLDKPHGLIVDYIGIGDELREATAKYAKAGDKAEPAPDISSTARPLFHGCRAEVRELLPAGHDYGGWRRLPEIELEDLYALVYGSLTDDDALRNRFLQAEMRLSSVFLLVKHLEDCQEFADEIIFYQRVRKQIGKAATGMRKVRPLEEAVRDLVDDSVESTGVVDIFKVAGLEKADISILDDHFLQTFKDRPYENLRLKLLEQLLQGELRRREKNNLAKYRSFREMLEATLQRYHNRLIDAAAVIEVMLKIREEELREQQRASELNLAPEELAFYDAVAENLSKIYDQQFLTSLIHDVVQAVKRNLKVDWTEPHRDAVRAEVRAAVRRVLRMRAVRREDFDYLIERIMEQAAALYADWPVAA
jgi:type I restriction enzyme R subunit